MKTEICDFCGKEIPNEPRLVLKDPQIMKKDGSDIVLCADCLNNYTSGDYDKIKLKGEVKNRNAKSK